MVWESTDAVVMEMFRPSHVCSVLGASLCAACASSHPYRIDASYTPTATPYSPMCRRAATTYVVPDVPVADTVLGDWVVECGTGCPRDYAEGVLMQLAGQRGAAHVSSLSCARHERGWFCVGRASAPARCDEGA